MSLSTNDYIIERFTLSETDYKKMASIITEAFLSDPAALEEGATIQFNENTFRMFFGAPSTKNDYFVRAIHKPTQEEAGFLGLVSRDLSVNGKIYKMCIPAWLSVHPAHRRKGVAKELGKAIMKIVKEEGFDGCWGLFEPEQHGLDTAVSIAKEIDGKIVRLMSTDKFIIRVFEPEEVAKVVKLHFYEKWFFHLVKKVKKPNNPHLRQWKKDDFEELFTLTQEFVKKNQISVVQRKEDFKHILFNEATNCVVYEGEDNKIKGFMLAWEFDLAGFGNSIKFGWLDMIQIYDLTKKEATELSNYLAYTSKIERGWKGIQAPYIPYFNPKPLQKANFVFFPKILTLDLMKFKEIEIPEEIKRIYFDWR